MIPPDLSNEVRAARLALGNGRDGFADVSRARIALQVAEDLLAEATPASGPWMVVRKRDTDPPEVWLFAGHDDAAAFFSQAQMQWSETYCCRVAYGPGHPMPAGEAPAPAEDGRLSAHVARYMREQMAMSDADSDQEQNWIAGHMVTFAAQVLSQAARGEAPVLPQQSIEDGTLPVCPWCGEIVRLGSSPFRKAHWPACPPRDQGD